MLQNSILLILTIIVLNSCRSIGAIPLNFSSIPSAPARNSHFHSYNKDDFLLLRYIEELYTKDETGKCKLIKEVEVEVSEPDISLSEIKSLTKDSEGDSYYILDRKISKENKEIEVVAAEIYKCLDEPYKLEDLKVQLQKNHENSDLTFSLGSYLTRQGVLRELGDLGYNFGISFTSFTTPIFKNLGITKTKSDKHGLFMLWTFDHFKNTKSEFLKIQFFDEDYTNYMVAGGYAFRYFIHPNIQFHYKGGFALNFIEIDTFGAGGTQKDKEFSDVTLSTLHKVSIDYLLTKVDAQDILRKNQVRIGPSLLYYWAPDPLGKFRANNNKTHLTTGGSISWSLDLTSEFY